MMNRGYIYEGMIVSYLDEQSIVIKKTESSITLLKMNGEILDIGYATAEVVLKPIEEQAIKFYNKKTIERHSVMTSRFNKNAKKDLFFENGSHVFFTSDTHFCHDKVINFCNRPFNSVEEMNNAIIDAWNKKVDKDDIVFHLGDFCWGGSKEWNSILDQLNGHIHLICGNHDVKNLKLGVTPNFESITFQKEIFIEGRSVYLNHYPFLTWGGVYGERGTEVWQLFGHVHSKKNDYNGRDSERLKYMLPQQMDVGVDSTDDYAPYSWSEIKSKIEKQING